MDKYINRIATDVIAISPAVEQILTQREGLSASKVNLIPHGLDFTNYEVTDVSRVKALQDKYRLTPQDNPVIGVIARYDEPKGHQYIINAFRQLLGAYPQAKLVLANARGSYKKQVQAFLTQIPKANYVEIEYEYDVIALYKTFDVFVHVPTSVDYESFGLVYLEALALGTPSVFTLSGIASEFIQHEQNALVVPYCDANALAHAMQRLVQEPTLTERLTHCGAQDVRKRFNFEQFFSKLEELYLRKASR
jgi:glycosyltransferase involved in cell wall biosynthesis